MGGWYNPIVNFVPAIINGVMRDKSMLMTMHNKCIDFKSNCVEMKYWLIIIDNYIQIDATYHLRSR